MPSENKHITFASLGLPDVLVEAVRKLGYENPTPIQAESIPVLLQGKDLLGQAQTGTGKTAAFALPLLANIDASTKGPQALILAPTRELALQVAEALSSYARGLKGFHVLPVYGGQSFEPQLRALRRGVNVVVGTPGRVMDHMRRGTMNLDKLSILVLDEADEMLRMGFIDDVEWVMERIPSTRQVVLFSATLPRQIRRVADKFLNDPTEIRIESKIKTAETIRQRFWPVSGVHKLDALTRILEAEPFDAMIVFVRTKNLTEELADKLGARGFAAAAINGDMQQQARERTIFKLKSGALDILVATDVAARGLDVERVSHVLNYDIPYDPESYVHRIGRTGRAGREGEAILFVAPRERRMLQAIERTTGKSIERMTLPSTDAINDRRVQNFKDQIVTRLGENGLELYSRILEELQFEKNVSGLELAAALAALWQGSKPLLLKDVKEAPAKAWDNSNRQGDKRTRERKPHRHERDEHVNPEPEALPNHPDVEMQRFRLDVGRSHGVKPANIVGAIANEADLDSQYIGHIKLFEDFSTVDLPAGMPPEIRQVLGRARVCGQTLSMQALSGDGAAPNKPHTAGKEHHQSKSKGPRRHQSNTAAGKVAGKTTKPPRRSASKPSSAKKSNRDER